MKIWIQKVFVFFELRQRCLEKNLESLVFSALVKRSISGFHNHWTRFKSILGLIEDSFHLSADTFSGASPQAWHSNLMNNRGYCAHFIMSLVFMWCDIKHPPPCLLMNTFAKHIDCSNKDMAVLKQVLRFTNSWLQPTNATCGSLMKASILWGESHCHRAAICGDQDCQGWQVSILAKQQNTVETAIGLGRGINDVGDLIPKPEPSVVSLKSRKHESSLDGLNTQRSFMR